MSNERLLDPADEMILEEEREVEKKQKELTLAEKDYWLAVYCGLSGSDRFKDFVKNNFEVQNIVDHESKKYEIRVIEKPVAVGPKLSPNQIFKLQALITSHGAKDAVDCVKGVMKILGQESSSIITKDEPLKLLSLDEARKKLD